MELQQQLQGLNSKAFSQKGSSDLEHIPYYIFTDAKPTKTLGHFRVTVAELPKHHQASTLLLRRLTFYLVHLPFSSPTTKSRYFFSRDDPVPQTILDARSDFLRTSTFHDARILRMQGFSNLLKSCQCNSTVLTECLCMCCT